ncbi:MAG TPA: hypothetical protein VHY22_11440 [Chthoniobacteraceae bacterium]|jgi:hypothetical protein|nr:hypothetical protein [Chthoniobacteraceae bacterium]
MRDENAPAYSRYPDIASASRLLTVAAAMLVFIVPLQSPQVSVDWRRVSTLCEQTLRSICAQAGGEFRVFLVCNEAPAMDFTHPALTIIEEPFPIPGRNTDARMFDKHQKIKRGLLAARGLAPCHVMVVDADDCVSRGLAAWCERRPGHPGWYLRQGYVYHTGSRWMHRWNDFDLLCGSTAIIRCEDADFPRTMSDPKENFIVVDTGHWEFRNPQRTQGRILEPLPFPGAVYFTATGENYTGINLRGWQGRKLLMQKLLSARLLTRRMREEFGI